jgi:membrane protease YdiL (CAAX protease family)
VRTLFRRVLFLSGLGFLALVLSMFFQGVWAAMLVINLKTSPAVPWAIALMAVLLWLVWQYVGGKWWPRSTANARRHFLRANRISRKILGWAIVAGALSIVALSGYWIVIVQLVKMPGNPLPDFSGYPLLTVVLTLVMAAIVGAVAEEAAFRGYFQVALERELSAPVAIVISSLLISPAHGLTQGFLWPTLLWYFFADVMFGVLAYLTNSILPGIVIHAAGLLVFFSLIWPADRSRRLVTDGGADAWFWVHAGQAIIFTALAIMAFRHLAQIRSPHEN